MAVGGRNGTERRTHWKAARARTPDWPEAIDEKMAHRSGNRRPGSVRLTTTTTKAFELSIMLSFNFSVYLASLHISLSVKSSEAPL